MLQLYGAAAKFHFEKAITLNDECDLTHFDYSSMLRNQVSEYDKAKDKF